MAAPGVVGTASGERVGAGTITVTPPAGAVAFLAVAEWYGSLTDMSPASGFSLVARGTVENPWSHWGLWIASAAPGSSWSKASTSEGGVVVVQGLDAAFTVDHQVGTNNTLTAPTVTTTVIARIFRLLTTQPFNGTPTIGYPAAATDGRFAEIITNGAENWVAAIASVAQTSAGATGTATFTLSGASNYGSRAHTLALSSTATGTTYAASGTAAATSGSSGAATLVRPTGGTAAAASSSSGSTTALLGASGTAAATSTTEGATTAVLGAAGAAVAVSASTGAATALLPASGTAAASSGSTGAVVGVLPTSGTAPVVSGSSGSADVVTGPQTYPASGTAAAVSGSSGTAVAVLQASGTADAVSGSSGSATGPGLHAASGTAQATSSSSGSASLIAGASGTTALTVLATGAVVAILRAAGAAAVVSSSSGSATLFGEPVAVPARRPHATLLMPASRAALASPGGRATVAGNPFRAEMNP